MTKLEKKRKSPNKWDRRRIYLATRWPVLYSVFFGIIWLRPQLNSLSYGNLDPSFIYGVEQAALNRISFGNHFIATYGPFSYAVNNFLPQNVLRSMLWQISAVILVGYGVHLLSRLYFAGFSRFSRIALCLVLLLALALAIPEWLYLDVFILYLFIYLRLDGKQKIRLQYVFAIASAVLSLVKFTDGAAALAGLIFAIALSEYREIPIKAILKKLISTSITYFISLTLIALLLGTTNVFAYIISALRISNGFNDALSSVTPQTSIGTKYVAIGFILFVTWIILRFRKNALKYGFLLPIFYVIWKYSIVRVDGHVITLLEVLPSLLILVLVSDMAIRVRDALFMATSLACFVIGIYGAGISFALLQATVSSPINNVQTHGFTHFFEVSRMDNIWKSQTDINLQVAKLPQTMRRSIGSSGVDIYPWEAVVVKANNLKWDPRPSPFSFESYTTQFDMANANFYLHSGPKFIIWHGFSTDGVSGIDSRTDLWDEPQTLKVILADYKYVSSSSQFILLERVSDPTEVPNIQDANRIKLSPEHVGTNIATIPVSNQLVCMNLNITDNNEEKIKTALVRERPFNMFLLYQDGTLRQLRFVKEIGNDGMLANDLPRNWSQLIDLFQSHRTGDQVLQYAVAAEPTTTATYYPCLLNK